MDSIRVPKMLYGVRGAVGTGWRKVIKVAWNDGWEKALRDIEWIDLLQSPGLIVYERAPNALLVRKHFDEHPFFAAYLTRDILDALEWKEPRSFEKYCRLRDLHIEASAWPWYLFGAVDPHKAGLPCRSDYFPEDQWQQEEIRTSRARLVRAMTQFRSIRLVENRLTADGMQGMKQMLQLLHRHGNLDYPPECWLLDGWSAVILGGLAEMEFEQPLFMEIVKMPAPEAEKRIRKWMEEKGIESASK